VGTGYRRVARLLVLPLAATLAMVGTPGAWAQTGTVLYTFTGGTDGANPQGNLIVDPAGNLYGTTTHGGDAGQGDGTVYQLVGNGTGWTENVIHRFVPADGFNPETPLAIDGQGNLYGTTFSGGANGQGAVFEMSPAAGGTWTFQVIYSFTGLLDGSSPADGVILDSSGNLYGTANATGQNGGGLVYELSRNGSGWTQTVLHQFISADGRFPGARGTLAFDSAGNLYGTTVGGGSVGAGVAYRLSRNGSTWTQTILHTFTGGSDGTNPLGTLLVDPSGAIYGTTSEGGTSNNGTVYRLTRTGNRWTHTVIYNFPGGASGRFPFAGVIRDPAGNLYGTTTAGAQGAGGVVYKLAPSGSTWTESVLYTLVGAGVGSYGGLLRDSAGNLFGVDVNGGASLFGEVFEVTP
jgi:uncharacterized repeat protein (TIGR03803 family)